ncbi:MAG: hypothetical protein JWM90_515 [Thermoleophilia bacterium]|nr:hypothetical protein [Thermoleophilia bacterium]
MAEAQQVKVSYPYMTGGQWFGVRAKFRQSVPGIVTVDWLMAALGTSEKGARNLIPQLRGLGLIGGDGKPSGELVHDLRDDSTYPSACRTVLEATYPDAIRSAWDDPDADPEQVANWFMRNAGTGAAMAKLQAKLYLLLLKAELPSADDSAKSAVRKTPTTVARKAAPKAVSEGTVAKAPVDAAKRGATQLAPAGIGPNLHIDMQIHISADASDAQIDTIFKSMAKHLYGRE